MCYLLLAEPLNISNFHRKVNGSFVMFVYDVNLNHEFSVNLVNPFLVLRKKSNVAIAKH